MKPFKTIKLQQITSIFIASKNPKATGSILIPKEIEKPTQEKLNKISSQLENFNKKEDYMYLFGEGVVYFEDNGQLFKIENEKQEHIGTGHIKTVIHDYQCEEFTDFVIDTDLILKDKIDEGEK